MRLFVAIQLPADAAERASQLLPTDHPALRLLPAPLLHLTLAFIGNVPEARLAGTSAAVRAAAAGTAAFDITLDTIGRFPERGQPSIVWLGTSGGAEELVALGRRVRGALRARDVTFDDKPLRPHVTLGRVRRGTVPAAIADLVTVLAALEPAPVRFRADALHVVQSVLSSKGPRYSSLQAAPLGGMAGGP